MTHYDSPLLFFAKSIQSKSSIQSPPTNQLEAFRSGPPTQTIDIRQRRWADNISICEKIKDYH